MIQPEHTMAEFESADKAHAEARVTVARLEQSCYDTPNAPMIMAAAPVRSPSVIVAELAAARMQLADAEDAFERARQDSVDADIGKMDMC